MRIIRDLPRRERRPRPRPRNRLAGGAARLFRRAIEQGERAPPRAVQVRSWVMVEGLCRSIRKALSIPANLPLAGTRPFRLAEVPPSPRGPIANRHDPSRQRPHRFQIVFLAERFEKGAGRHGEGGASLGWSPRQPQSKRFGETARGRHAESRRVDKGEQFQQIEGGENRAYRAGAL